MDSVRLIELCRLADESPRFLSFGYSGEDEISAELNDDPAVEQPGVLEAGSRAGGGGGCGQGGEGKC